MGTKRPCQWHTPPSRPALGLDRPGFVIPALLDADKARFEVDVLRAKAANLSAAQPGEQRRRPNGLVLRAKRAEELCRLGRIGDPVSPSWLGRQGQSERGIDQNLSACKRPPIDRSKRQDRVSDRGGAAPGGDQRVKEVLDGRSGYGGEAKVTELGQDLGSQRLLIGTQGRRLIGSPGAGPDDLRLSAGEPVCRGIGERGLGWSAKRPRPQRAVRLGPPGPGIRERAKRLSDRSLVPSREDLGLVARAAVTAPAPPAFAIGRMADNDSLGSAAR